MIRLTKRLLLTAAILLLGTLTLPSLLSPVALAQPQDVCRGAQLSGVDVDCADGRLEPSDSQFGNVIRTIITILSIVVGAISVIMIIIGGFRYVISGGDSNATKGAKDTIMYAVIGLVIVIFAQVIVRFVFTSTQRQPGGDEGAQHQPTRLLVEGPQTLV